MPEPIDAAAPERTSPAIEGVTAALRDAVPRDAAADTAVAKNEVPGVCSNWLCLPGVLSGLDCPALLSGCDNACQAYLGCVEDCVGADAELNCDTLCHHRTYRDDAGRLQTSSLGEQFLACTCCGAAANP